MALKLGELLVNKKLFTRQQLEEALENQAVFGGKLGTILLEMGAVGELDLAQVLSVQLGVPFVHPDQLVDIPAAALNALTPEMAQKYQVLPIRLENRMLTVVMANPCDLKAIDELGFRTGYVIRPIVAPELRLAYALEHYYQLPRKRREIVPHHAVRRELARLERGGPSAAAPIVAPLAPPPEPDLADLGVDLVDVRGEPVLNQQTLRAEDPGERQPNPGRVKVPRENVGELSFLLQHAVRQLAEARNHDDVAAAVLLTLGARYARVALFTVAGGQAIGWYSTHKGVPISGWQNVRFPLEEGSALQAASASQKFISGPLGRSGADLALLRLLGEPAPASSLILPLCMNGRVVSLIYLDDPQFDPVKSLPALLQFVEKVQLCFELLVIRSKILRLTVDNGVS